MNAQPRLFSERQAEPDLIDRIADALPEELRKDYYREVSHCRTLPENDEMLRILRAMQFLTLLIHQAPGQVAVEREQIAEILARSIEAMQATHQASIAYQKQLEDRLAKLPEEIAEKIGVEAIAAKLSESLRQQFHGTGLPQIGDSIGVQVKTLRQASGQLSGVLDDFTRMRTGEVPRMKSVLSDMTGDLKNAADHVRMQMNGLGNELWRTIGVLCFGALVAGILIGLLYQRWRDAPATASTPPPAAVVQPGAPPQSSPEPHANQNRKKRSQPITPP